MGSSLSARCTRAGTSQRDVPTFSKTQREACDARHAAWGASFDSEHESTNLEHGMSYPCPAPETGGVCLVATMQLE